MEPASHAADGRRYHTVDDSTVAVALHEPGPTPDVPEAFVQALWRDQRFDRQALSTTDGQPITVLDPGTLNTDSGPDFTGVHLRIGSMTWHGAVEVHTTSGDWFAHEHHRDPRYNSVVLHVTLQRDVWTGGLLREDETLLPELVLAPCLEAPLRTLLFQHHTRSDHDLLCAPRWDAVPDARRADWIERLARERFAEKRARLAECYLRHPVLDQLLYERLFAGLGYAKNAEAMEALARRLPLDTVRLLDDPLDREALFFGTAGLLPNPGDLLESDRATADYIVDLHTRYRRLNAQHAVASMERTQWTFFRLRPANFPALRIAQGAALFDTGGLLHHAPVGRLAEALTAAEPVDALRTTLTARPSAFWETHFRLAKATKPYDPSLGRSRIDTLIVNAVLPVLLLFAEQESHPDLAERAFDVLRRLPAGRDSVLQRFADLGTRPASAFEAQGLHQLYRRYCREGRCLSCAIGHHVLGMEEVRKG